MKSQLLVLVTVFSVLSGFSAGPKNVILFIGDGMSVPQRMIADEFSRKVSGKTLAMNHLPQQALTRTCSADSLITDSAAAATAIACGRKTNNHYLGVNPKGEALESCAAVAKKSGRKVGIVTTVTITHATPGGFYAHRKNRGDTEGIARDLADSGFDLFAGGGLKVNEKKSKAYEYAVEKGYRLVKTREEFLQLEKGCGKILTRFTNEALPPTIDLAILPQAKELPSLAEIVSKSLELLENDNGFFLMVEGGRIDWAGHANDAATNLRDVLALDDAVGVALKFAAAHTDDTLVVVTGDHETGGMAMGFSGTGYALYMDRLANQKMSVDAFDERFRAKLTAMKGKAELKDFEPLVHEAFGFVFGGKKGNPMSLTADELKKLQSAFENDCALVAAKTAENAAYDKGRKYQFGSACRIIMSNKSGIGWTSGSHTAMPVLTTAQGVGAERFTGMLDNTDISKILKELVR